MPRRDRLQNDAQLPPRLGHKRPEERHVVFVGERRQLRHQGPTLGRQRQCRRPAVVAAGAPSHQTPRDKPVGQLADTALGHPHPECQPARQFLIDVEERPHEHPLRHADAALRRGSPRTVPIPRSTRAGASSRDGQSAPKVRPSSRPCFGFPVNYHRMVSLSTYSPASRRSRPPAGHVEVQVIGVQRIRVRPEDRRNGPHPASSIPVQRRAPPGEPQPSSTATVRPSRSSKPARSIARPTACSDNFRPPPGSGSGRSRRPPSPAPAARHPAARRCVIGPCRSQTESARAAIQSTVAGGSSVTPAAAARLTGSPTPQSPSPVIVASRVPGQRHVPADRAGLCDHRPARLRAVSGAAGSPSPRPAWGGRGRGWATAAPEQSTMPAAASSRRTWITISLRPG